MTAASQANLDSSLIEAAKLGNTQLVVSLIDNGADPNTEDSVGYTPLIFASIGDHSATVEALLKLGANPSHRDSMQWDAKLHAAFNQSSLSNALLSKKKISGISP